MSKIQGVDVKIQLSSDGVTYKTLVCETQSQMQLQRQINETRTKCGGGTTEIGLGAKTYTITGSAAIETAPAGTEVSYSQLLTWFEAGTLIYVKYESPTASGTNFYHQGQAYITDLNVQAQTDQVVTADLTIRVSGTLDVTP